MRNKLKNLTAITLALALGLAVVGCGGSAAEAPASAAPQAPAAPAMHRTCSAAPAHAQRAMPAARCDWQRQLLPPHSGHLHRLCTAATCGCYSRP